MVDPLLTLLSTMRRWGGSPVRRARLLTVKGYGHTEFTNPSTCAANHEVQYLTSGALPPARAVCQQDGTPFGISSDN